MFLTVHGALGILIGRSVKNPILAFGLGFISHYLFDIIPHGDTKAPQKWKNPIHMALAALIDLTILTVSLIWLGTKINILTPSIALACLGALLPDFLQGFYFLSNRKLFKKWQKYHDCFHLLISKNWEWNFFLGLALQIIFYIILVSIII